MLPVPLSLLKLEEQPLAVSLPAAKVVYLVPIGGTAASTSPLANARTQERDTTNNPGNGRRQPFSGIVKKTLDSSIVSSSSTSKVL